ncbi:MAG: hypothetical protein HFH53_07110 [Hespellia sp.]|nr:hypothetical protein [Hespellia sp.]
MKWQRLLFLAIALIGGLNSVYQIYRMTEIDARARGLKHPKFWGLFAISGQGGEGILLYLLGRRKFVSVISEKDQREIESRKKKTGVGLLFLAVGAVGMVLCIVFYI